MHEKQQTYKKTQNEYKEGERKTPSYCNEQEAQLMLTNLHDALIGQSRSSNIVPFHMLGIFPLAQ